MIGNEGARFLGMLLLQNTDLTHLYLEGNPIDDEGCEHLAVGLKNNRSLEYLYLNNSQITGIGAMKFAQVLTQSNDTLKCLPLYNNNYITEKYKEQLKQLCGDRICVYNPL